jgi:hypothetical protein
MTRTLLGLTAVTIVLLAAAFLQHLEGQGGMAFISGRVRSEFGEVVVGAQVTSARSDVSVHSDSTGRFRLGPLKAGVDTIMVWASGYDESRPVIVRVHNRQHVTRDWVLVEYPIELRDVAALDGPVRLHFYAFHDSAGRISRDSVGFNATTTRDYNCIMPLRVATARTPTGSVLYLVGVGAFGGLCAQAVAPSSGGEVLSIESDSTTVMIVDQERSATYLLRRLQRGFCVQDVSSPEVFQLSVAQDPGGRTTPADNGPPDTQKLRSCS